MTIDIDIYHVLDARGCVSSVDVRSTILYSPREGFDPDKIENLERDIGLFIQGRLNAAIKKGCAE